MVQRARAVALFWPIEARHEVDLRRSRCQSLRARGVTVAYPSIDEETREMTCSAPWPTSARLEERGMGFAEPSPDRRRCCGRGELDVIVVPAIAIDPRGHRIGYGAGFYDRTLPGPGSHRRSRSAVAYDYQLVADVPDTEGDVPVDWIVTDTRVVAAER